MIEPGFYYVVDTENITPIGVMVQYPNGNSHESHCTGLSVGNTTRLISAKHWDNFGFWDRLFPQIKHN